MLIASALAILLSWVVIAIILIGMGCILLRLFGGNFLLLDGFWMGLALSMAALEIWNLFLPVNSSITILLCCIGVLGLILNRSVIFSRLRMELQVSRYLILPYIAIVLFIAFRASGPCDYYDTGLYGATAVRWILNFPVVPGLANLYGRLGFNSSIFLWIAALSQGPWRALAYHLFTGLIISAIWATLLPSCFRLVGKSSTSPTDWFYCILVIPLSFWTTRSEIVGTLTDGPAAIACLVATGIIFDELREKTGADELTHNKGNLRLLVATVILALAVSFKESTAVFALLVWILAFGRIWMGSQSVKEQRKYILGAVALSTLVLLPWCLRGVILSGYPFFPATILGFGADWKTPADVADWYASGVRSFARIPDVPMTSTQGLRWLGVWVNHILRDRVSFQVPLGISLSGLAVALCFRASNGFRQLYPWLWLLLPSLIGMVFWFATAPGLRFAQFAIWTTAGTLGTWGIVTVASKVQRDMRMVFLTGILIAIMWNLSSFGWSTPYRLLLSVKSLPPLPKANTTVRYTSSGLAIYVPTEGNQCWDAALPCTPYFDETLRLRDEKSMGMGFISKQTANDLKRFDK